MSTRQKRDADMDRLLRAVLKPAPQGSAGDCPEPGVLAAFVEGGLTAAEQSALDAHIVNCGRCQEALAVVSDELLHGLPREEEDTAAAPQSGWFTWVTQPRLRWLVPISAAATVAVMFFATRPLIAPEGEAPDAEVAQMAQAPAASADTPGAAVDALQEKSTATTGKGEVAGARERADAATPPAAQSHPSKAAADVRADLAPPAERERGGKPAEPAAELMAARVGSEEKRVQPTAPVPAAPPAGAGLAADAMRAMPAPPPVREELRRMEPMAVVTAALDRTVRWRFGPGGRIWRSTDAGSTWDEQRSGVSASLVAGSAPSATTCWAVGTAGVVLLTEDGQRWTLLPFPLRVDLVAVQAADSRIATVTTHDGRRFETRDAGSTWSPR